VCVSGKRDDIFERQGLIFIQYSSNYSGTMKEMRECLGFLKDDSNSFRKIPSTRESLWEGFPKVIKALANS
jgi:hypothetical protein